MLQTTIFLSFLFLELLQQLLTALYYNYQPQLDHILSIVTTMAPEKDSNVVQRPKNSEIPVPRGKLPDELQKMVDDEETLLDQIYDGT